MGSPQPPVLHVDAATRRFPDGTVALDRFDLTVARSELVSVVGPSGCGKTTLLRLCSGLDEPSEGAVQRWVDQVAHVFQEPALLPWRSVLGNVELAGELAGVDRSKRRATARWALDAVGLDDVEQLLPSQMSVGMRMRASLAQSLTSAAGLFLLDEPFAAVDEITRGKLQDLWSGLFAELGVAGVFVTHSIPEAVYLGTRVLVLSVRPARVAAEIEVPWTHPRDPELRFDPAFAQLCGQVHQALETGAR
ncbi:MAG: ABC transporter ATP-binding protein [Acidimicrobiales bacterium]|nr:ABC transporter ATP-binding protein [Acidimicrobiales bacterium]